MNSLQMAEWRSDMTGKFFLLLMKQFMGSYTPNSFSLKNLMRKL